MNKNILVSEVPGGGGGGCTVGISSPRTIINIDKYGDYYITLHYITLHYITLHYITLHYITLIL